VCANPCKRFRGVNCVGVFGRRESLLRAVCANPCKRFRGVNCVGVFGRRESLLSSSRRSRPSRNYPDRTERSAQGRAASARRSGPLRASTVLLFTGSADGRIRGMSAIPLVGRERFWLLPQPADFADPITAHGVQIVQHLLPVLHRFPFRHHSQQRQIQQLKGGFFGGKRPARFDDLAQAHVQ
jgi:hypothetical protein